MQKRILVISDCPTLNTGYARVSRFVATTLARSGYRVRYLPCNATIPNSERVFDFELDKFDPRDRYCGHRVGSVLSTFRPSLVMVFGEFSFVGFHGNVCRQQGVKSLYYLPVEGEGYPPHFVYLGGGHIDYKLTLLKFDYVVAYSEFGKRNIDNLLPGIVTDVIPHQVNTEIFRPLDKRKCRELFFPHVAEDPNLGVEKMFVVGAVYRNMRRKGVDYLIQGMSHFIKKYERDRRVYGFFVIDPRDTRGYNLEALIRQHGVDGRIALHPVIGGKEGPEDNQLCEIYNTFDVHLCPFRAEGFGIPIVESLATGSRVVATEFATPAEYGQGVLDFIKPSWLEPIEGTNTEWAVLNPQDVGDAVGRVYNEKTVLSVYDKGVELARKFDEKVVAVKWLQLLADLNLPEVSAKAEEPECRKSVNEAVADSYFEAIEG